MGENGRGRSIFQCSGSYFLMQHTTEIKEAIQLLSQQRLKDLYQFIAEIMSINIPLSNLNKEISESRFAKDLSLEHKQIPRRFHKNGIYPINRVNNLHSRFKQ